MRGEQIGQKGNLITKANFWNVIAGCIPSYATHRPDTHPGKMVFLATRILLG
jgi:hypothetical protein